MRLTTLLFYALVGLAAYGQTQAPTDGERPAEIDPTEQAYQQLLELDDEALTKIDEWIRASQRPDATETESIAIMGKIKAQIGPVREAYEAFIKDHPEHSKARLTYASFLTDIGEETEALPHLIKATELDPHLPAAWNNLANYYGHSGDLKKAFTHYEKAISIKPDEAVYYHNFGTTVFLFRKDVKEHYNITEEEVFDKALLLYKKAQSYDPQNFDLAEDIAQTYYGIRTQDVPSKMARPNEALKAWRYAEGIAPAEFEKQGVYLHLARVYIDLADFAKAEEQLKKISLPVYQELRDRIARRVPGYKPDALPALPTPVDSL